MSEKPILFSAPMVRAILAGTKTQTRRVVKPQPDDEARITMGEIGSSRGVAYIGNSRSGGIVSRVPCPYGVPGDRLWVRESFYAIGESGEVFYRADGVSNMGGPLNAWTGPWKPSIHMPRWASRITLEITDVRVEQLQDISEEDAKAEGAPCIEYGDAYNVPHVLMRGAGFPGRGHAYGFQRVWGDINGAESWLANPWVWVIAFRPVTHPHTREG